MKSLTKKALSLAMAIAMVGSFAVSATSVDSVTKDGTKVSVAYTAADVTDQLTVIAYEVTAEGDETTAPTDASIVYINQWAKGEAPATITFDMRDTYVEKGAIKPGVYKVLIGGTGVSEMTAKYLVVTADAGIIFGDANGNGEVELGDAILVLRRTVNADVALDAAAADVNATGDVDLGDAILILRRTVNADVEFPAEAK